MNVVKESYFRQMSNWCDFHLIILLSILLDLEMMITAKNNNGN